MTTLFLLGLMFLAAIVSMVAIPLVLLKVILGVVLAVVAIPFKIFGSLFGGLVRGAVKGTFWLALILIPLAVIALPVTIMAFGAWFIYRALRPRRAPQAYVVG
jgi:hypothetical protein